MSCNDYNNKIALYIDNELSQSDKIELEQHISHCSDCQNELKLLLSINSLGEMAHFSEPGPTYWNQLSQNIMKKITERQRKTMAIIPIFERLRGFIVPIKLNYRLVGLAATAVIIFFIIHLALFQSGDFRVPVEIGAPDAVEFDQASNMVMKPRKNIGPAKDSLTSGRPSNVKPPTQKEGVVLPADHGSKLKPRMTAPGIKEKNQITIALTKPEKEPIVDNQSVPRQSAPVVEPVIQAEQQYQADNVALKKMTVESKTARSRIFSVTTLSKQSIPAETDFNWANLQSIKNVNEQIDMLENYLQNYSDSKAAQKIKIELAKLYFQRTMDEPIPAYLNSAFQFYLEHLLVLFSSPDSAIFKKNFSVINKLIKKNER